MNKAEIYKEIADQICAICADYCDYCDGMLIDQQRCYDINFILSLFDRYGESKDYEDAERLDWATIADYIEEIRLRKSSYISLDDNYQETPITISTIETRLDELSTKVNDIIKHLGLITDE